MVNEKPCIASQLPDSVCRSVKRVILLSCAINCRKTKLHHLTLVVPKRDLVHLLPSLNKVFQRVTGCDSLKGDNGTFYALPYQKWAPRFTPFAVLAEVPG